MKKAIVLLSGGLDSTVTAYYAINKGFIIKALTINYGQLHDVEISKATATADILNIEHIILPVSLPWKGSALLDKSIPLPKNRNIKSENKIPSTYVPARNTIFLSIALSWAEVVEADAIFIGANQVDYSGYPDCRKEYFQCLQDAFVLGTKKGVEGKPVQINTPLLELDKKDIILLGSKLNVPFENTWSCYNGGNVPCCSCDSCLIRKKGFREANISDPLLS